MTTELSEVPSTYKKLTLFLDGYTRTAILAHGPIWIHQIIPESSWTSISYYMAALMFIYTTGRAFGILVSSKIPKRCQDDSFITRVASAGVVLNLIVSGGGAATFLWLMLIRFASAAFVGILCGSTSTYVSFEDFSSRRKLEYSELYDSEGQQVLLMPSSPSSSVPFDSVMPFLAGIIASFVNVILIFCGLGRFAGGYEYMLLPFVAVGLYFALQRVLSQTLPKMIANEPKRTTSSRLSSPSRLPLAEIAHNNTSGARAINDDTLEELQVSPAIYETPETDGFDVEEFADPLASSMVRIEFASGPHTPARSRRASTAEYFDASVKSRSRFESSASHDDFYDCDSVFSDAEVSIQQHSKGLKEFEVARFSNNRCTYSDGSAAFVPAGDSVGTIPQNYLDFYGGNESKAQKAWERTQQWRMEKKVWKILSIPNPWYHEIKEAYPHFVHGHSKAGYPIIYEQPGKMNLKELFRNGCAIDDMVHHYTFFLEFISNVISTKFELRKDDSNPYSSSSFGIMVVMDVKGAGLSHLSGDVLSYLKKAGDTNSAHYPLTMKRAFVVKSPFWLAGAWSSIKGVLPDSVQVDILSEEKYSGALREYIDEDQIPPEYGGTSPYSLGDHPYERELRELAESVRDSPDENDSMTAEAFYSPARGQRQRTRSVSSRGLSMSPVPSKGTRSAPLRRRMNSTEQTRNTSLGKLPSSARKAKQNWSNDDDLLVMSLLLASWFLLQGVIESTLSMWLVMPYSAGGLGSSSLVSAFALLASTLSIMTLLKSRYAHIAEKLSHKPSLRNVRLAAFVQFCTICLFPVLRLLFSGSNILSEITLIIGVVVCLAATIAASTTGREALIILHGKAFEASSRDETSPRISKYLGKTRFITLSGNRTLSRLIGITFEVVGFVVSALLTSRFVSTDGSGMFGQTFLFYIYACLLSAAFFSTLSIHYNTDSDFAPRVKDSCTEVRNRQLFPLLRSAFATTKDEMRFLLSEDDLADGVNLNARLHLRSRGFSESSHQNESMERGQSNTQPWKQQ